MKTYYVEVPVVMKLMICVQAENEEEAKHNVFHGNISIDVNDDDNQFEDINYEWGMHEQVAQGNFYYGAINKMSIEEEEE